MRINEYDKRICASEIFSSGVCNLNCSYCYIPKNTQMQEYHNKILDKLTDGTFIQSLEEIYGKDLTHLGFWGTEQTLIFHRLAEDIKKYIEHFPRLGQIGFSTNMYAHADRIFQLFDGIEDSLAGTDREMAIQWQVSIDGPAWINDPGRGEGTTDRIVKNMYEFFEKLGKKEYQNITISFSLKSTVDIPYIRKMNEDFDLLVGYYEFFDEVCGTMREFTKDYKGKFLSMPSTSMPTLVVPGKYTSKDGEQLKVFFENIERVEEMARDNPEFLPYSNNTHLNSYYYRLLDLINNWNDIQLNPTQGTCSGGDTQIGLDLEGDIHTCHRTFLFNNDDYINSVYGENEYDEWSVSKLERGLVKNLRKYVIVNKDASEKDKLRSLYTYRSYHDSPYFKNSATINATKNMARMGQASKVFLESDETCHMFASFIDKAMSCPIESYLNTGSFHTYPISVLRIWANGAFEVLIKKYLDGRKDLDI